MKNVLRLFGYEFKNIYKQALVFSLISTFLFALSISVFCFSTDMVQGYKDYLDEDDYYDTLSIYGVTDFEKVEELDKICDYFTVQAYGITESIANYDGDEYGGLITYRPMLQKGEKEYGYHGMASIFKNELPAELDDYIIEDGEFGAAYNDKNANGNYSVYLYAKTAEELSADVGDNVTLNYELIDGMHAEEFTVAGIYRKKVEDNSSFHYQFLIPYAFVSEHNGKITTNEHDMYDGCCLYLHYDTPSKIMDALPKVRSLGFKDLGLGFGGIEEIDLVNTMRYILYGVAVAIVIVTFVVLSNSLTITVNSRKKFMAKLKLLGASTDKITAMYFVLLVLSFIAAYALSILLSFLLCGYFSSIASVALEYKITMQLHWSAVGVLFGVGCLLIAIRYLLFRRKVKKVSPAEFIKED